MRECKSTTVLISIIGASLLGDALYHPWGGVIGAIIGALIGMNHQVLTLYRKLFQYGQLIMNFKPTIVGLVAGIILCVVYVIKSYFCKKKSTLPKAIQVVLSCVGLSSAATFGWIVLFSSPEYLGNFREHKVIMVLGALAVIWISIESVCNTFL